MQISKAIVYPGGHTEVVTSDGRRLAVTNWTRNPQRRQLREPHAQTDFPEWSGDWRELRSLLAGVPVECDDGSPYPYPGQIR